ncbi:MAG: hypothetical protein P4L90_14385 [Rhodopila sp.]|nr:hypothetical protein [Rhodopila sp.]
MHFLEGGYPVWAAKQNILRTCDFGSVLVLGDSRPEAAIVPSRLGLPAANIASGAATPIENYFFARRAVSCPSAPRYVIYSQSLSSFVSANQFLWKNAARYGFIAFRDLRDIARAAAEQHDPAFGGTDTHDGLSGIARDLVYSSGFPSIFTASLVKARGFGRYDANIALFEHTSVTRGAVTYTDTPIRTDVGIDAQVSSFVPSPVQAYYFDKALDLFAAAGVRVLYVAIPVSESTVRAMKPKVAADFSQFLAQHTKKFSNLVVANPTTAAWPDDLFVDGSHMNERGAAILSERLAPCLSQWEKSPDRPVPCDLAWR